MWDVKDILLKVAKAYPNDSARGIARLDPNALLTLRLSPGDIIEIEGKRTTVAKVWRAEKQDWGQEMVRIDGATHLITANYPVPLLQSPPRSPNGVTCATSTEERMFVPSVPPSADSAARSG